MSIKKRLMHVINMLRTERKVPVYKEVNTTRMLEGKVALIVGGNGGIGKAIARAFLKHGAKVIISGTNLEKLQAATKELRNEDLRFVLLDMLDVASLKKKIVEAKGCFSDDRVDILVNCAGVNDNKPFLEVDEESFDRIMGINVKGTYYITQAISKYMIDNEIKGHILNVSSSSSLRPASQPYTISKWALNGMTKGFADELLPYGIIVNAIAPGPTATSMVGIDTLDDINHPTCPAGRYAIPDEIATLATYLVSNLGDMVVGDTIYISGGSGVISLHK